MTLLSKLNPDQVKILLLKKDERPMHYERAMVALTNNDNVFELTVGDAICIIDMCELDDAVAGLYNLYKYFKND